MNPFLFAISILQKQLCNIRLIREKFPELTGTAQYVGSTFRIFSSEILEQNGWHSFIIKAPKLIIKPSLTVVKFDGLKSAACAFQSFPLSALALRQFPSHCRILVLLSELHFSKCRINLCISCMRRLLFVHKLPSVFTLLAYK